MVFFVFSRLENDKHGLEMSPLGVKINGMCFFSTRTTFAEKIRDLKLCRKVDFDLLELPNFSKEERFYNLSIFLFWS